MGKRLDSFNEFRTRLNEQIHARGNLHTKRFFALDGQVYGDGRLSSKTKELLGLTASAVLRCDDCITYHLIQCAEAGVTQEEFFEAFNVILIVGGSITIPHVRRAVEVLEELEKEGKFKHYRCDEQGLGRRGGLHDTDET